MYSIAIERDTKRLSWTEASFMLINVVIEALRTVSRSHWIT